jgi:hypothetical protein
VFHVCDSSDLVGGGTNMQNSTAIYANFKSFSVRYDLKTARFQYSYASKKRVMDDTGIQRVVFGTESFTLDDYANVKASVTQHDDSTDLSLHYTGGPAIQEEFGIHFLMNDQGIRCTFACPGHLDVQVSGWLHWGSDMENETFAVNLNRQGMDLRCAYGPASSIVDNALFDRRSDSAIEINGCYNTRIQYDWDKKSYHFQLGTQGNDYTKGFQVRVLEHVYANRFHIDYQPVNPNTTFSTPPVGWMSWYAVQFEAGEKTVLENARWQAEHLKEFGANAVWVDWEWYHSDFTGIGQTGIDTFHPDPVRYPHGLKYVADQIKQLGLVPALWIGATNDPTENEFIREHPETILVQKPQWCGQYFFDLTHPLYLNEFLPRAFQQLLDWGYAALKWDCLPIQIQLSDAYHDRFYDPNLSTEQAMLGAVQAARRVVGQNYYMLYCAGTSDRDYSIAAAGFDAARIGGDIFKWEDFVTQCIARVMKLYAFHNVVFLNDPDNVILREKFNSYDQALSRLSFVSLLGLPITLGDHLPDLPEERVELLRRGIPGLSTHPMDIRKTVHDYRVVKVNLAVNKPYEQWNVIDVFNLMEEETEVTVDLHADIHLALEDGPYLVYDFWNKEYIGEVTRCFTSQLRPFASKVYAVRKKTGFPQVISTSRHLSQGAVDLVRVAWDEASKTLAGVSKVVKDDIYEIVIYIPDGLRILSEGHDTLSTGIRMLAKNLGCLRIDPHTTGETAWSIAFTPDSTR